LSAQVSFVFKSVVVQVSFSLSGIVIAGGQVQLGSFALMKVLRSPHGFYGAIAGVGFSDSRMRQIRTFGPMG